MLPVDPLFNIVTADITQILENSPTVNLIMYTDDLALGNPTKDKLQSTLQNLKRWARNNGFIINQETTVQITFQKINETTSSLALQLRVSSGLLKQTSPSCPILGH